MNAPPISLVICTLNLCGITADNKLKMLRNFVFSKSIDILLLQEVALSDFSFLRGYNSIVNIDENKRGTAIAIRDSIPYTNVKILGSSRGISVCIHGCNIINIYVPSGTQNRTARQLFSRKSSLICFPRKVPTRSSPAILTV